MTLSSLEALPKPRLKALLEHFAVIEAPREPRRVAHPLPEALLLVVCGTICDCEDYDAWPAAGLVDTEIRCFMEPEGRNAEAKEVQPRVQA